MGVVPFFSAGGGLRRVWLGFGWRGFQVAGALLQCRHFRRVFRCGGNLFTFSDMYCFEKVRFNRSGVLSEFGDLHPMRVRKRGVIPLSSLPYSGQRRFQVADTLLESRDVCLLCVDARDLVSFDRL
jgi:hypothetical protein